MTERNSFQRFLGELRRRHVGRTVAVYLVAAWAAIQFADVVVPNLNGPQWIVTAVIVAAGVGLPVALVLAWIFDWGPDGIQRTPDEAPRPQADADRAGSAPVPTRTEGAPWMAAMAVLVVAIASGLAVAALIEGTSDGAETGATGPSSPRPPELVGPEGEMNVDSIRSRVLRGLEQVESLGDLGRLGDLEALEALGEQGPDGIDLGDVARRAAVEADRHIFLEAPDEWKVGRRAPVELAEGDTLVVRGLAHHLDGLVSVSVDGSVAARAEGSERSLRFTARIVGTGAAGLRQVVIAIETAGGREIQAEYPVRQRPATGTAGGGAP